ncbi:MAG: carboxypeptidase regulatory-like domain-containing protein [Acidobacteriota bacterium]
MFGQTGLATLTGTVTDQTGAVVANVTVTAKQVATGTTVTAVTSDTGNYTIPQLRVGDYEVSIEQTGFKAYLRSGITLSAAQTLRLDVALEVGATSDSVTVTSEASLLHMDSGTMVANLSPAQIQNLPLLPISTGFIRDPFALGNTVAGVLQTFTGTRVNGLGQSSIQYRLEGEVLGNQGFAGITTRTQPSPDAIEEVAVQTTNIPVEFGSASGAVYNVSIKSGTNKFHGTVFDYAINEVLNSADRSNHTRNRIRRHDYGFNIGGPVKIPKIYDGTNKTFFFFNWEQYRDAQKAFPTSNPTVPTQDYRSGDFSSLLTNSPNLRLTGGTLSNGTSPGAHDYIDPLGNPIRLGTIFDPTTTRSVICSAAIPADCTAGASVLVRTPFPNNRIPTSMLDPVALAVLNKYVPTPNVSNTLINNYQTSLATSRITSSPAIKGDQNFGSKARMSFTYTQNKTTAPVQTLGGLAEGFPEPITRNTGTYENGPSYRMNLDYTIRPTINYHLGLGYSIFEFDTRPLTTDYNALTDIGLRGATANKNFPLFNLVPLTNPALGGLSTLGTPGQTGAWERRPSITQTVSYVRNNHTYKVGADFRQDMLPNLGFGGANGSYTFSSQGATWNPALLGIAGFQGNTNVGFNFANYLLGSVSSASLSTPVLYRRTKQQYGIFIQDTWRASRKLTVDYGIRWDYGTYAKEDYGRLGALSLTVPNTSASGHPGGTIYEATCNCHFAQNYPYAIGPRLGLAYTLNPKTVIRGGIGLAYGSTPIVGGVAQNTASTPSVQPYDEAFKLRDGIPTSVNPIWPNYDPGFPVPVGGVASATNTPTLIDPNAGRPDRTVQWNISLQREVTKDLVVEVSYVGNRGAWQSTGGFQDFNAISEQTLAKYNLTVGNTTDSALLQQTLAAASPAQLAQKGIFRPYPNFPTNQTVLQSLKAFPQYAGAIAPAAPMGRSWYDALQINVTKRYSHGLQLTANYTFSKNLSYSSSPDIFNRANGKDINLGNPPQVLRISFAYNTPKISNAIPVLGNKWVSFGLKDWQIAGALFYQTAPYLARPTNNGANPISQWLGRGPGGAQLKKNSDGSYMSPWGVNWTDLDGKVHAEPLDINCHCFDPEKTQVLNPAAWEAIPAGQWGAQTQQLPFLRAARRPSENANLARNFRMGPDGRYTLQLRVEFTNIFNRTFLPNPYAGVALATNPGNPSTPIGVSSDGRYVSGFGTFGNLRNAGAFNVAGNPAQRQGTFIARFSF